MPVSENRVTLRGRTAEGGGVPGQRLRGSLSGLRRPSCTGAAILCRRPIGDVTPRSAEGAAPVDSAAAGAAARLRGRGPSVAPPHKQRKLAYSAVVSCVVSPKLENGGVLKPSGACIFK